MRRPKLELILKIDMHVHTWYSDSGGSVDEVIEVAQQKRLDGIAITDHETMEGAYEAIEKKSDLIIIPGEEVKTDQGELLALGIKKAVPPRLPIADAINRIHGQDGLVVVPHPTLPLFSRLKEKDMRSLPIDGLEVFSALTPFSGYFLKKNLKLAQRLGVSVTGGSDSHHPETVGDACTLVCSESRDLKDILNAIKLGHTNVEGIPSGLTFKLRILKGLFTNFFRNSRKDGRKSRLSLD